MGFFYNFLNANKGEDFIKNYLERNEIKYIRQKSFEELDMMSLIKYQKF